MPSKPGQGAGIPRPSKARQKALALGTALASPEPPAPSEVAAEVDEIVETLPLRKLKFIEHYLEVGVAKTAAELAGYAESTARSAWRLLRDPEIAAVITLRQREMLSELGLTHRRALEELKAIAISRVTDYTSDGETIGLVQGADPRAIGAVQSVKMTRRRLARGRPPLDPEKDTTEVEESFEFKLWDKGRALDRALELLGLVERGGRYGGGGGGGSNDPPDAEEAVRGVGVRVTLTGGPTGIEATAEAVAGAAPTKRARTPASGARPASSR